MIQELRIVTTAFTATPTESERIKAVVKTLPIGKSEYMRNLVMKDVEKREKKLKG